MKHIVSFSYGIGSWAAAKLVVAKHGAADTILLNADTKMEDEDTYAWGAAAAKNVGAELVRIADGRDVWQVFFDERYLGNSHHDPCSKILKRELMDRWVSSHFRTSECRLYVGIHWSESDRFSRWDKKKQRWRGVKHRMADLGFVCEAPLCEPPLIAYEEIHRWAEKEGLWKQRLYQLGFPHANCGGFCIKAGQAHFKRLLETMPERYAYHERREQELRAFLGKDVSILSDRRGGKKRPLTLRDLRERIEAGGQCDLLDWGACGCFSGEDDEESEG